MNSQTLIFCSYRNCTDRVVILRARGLSTYYLERVVFPFELMTFHCPRECEVEVVMRTPGGLEESEWVAAEELVAGEQLTDLEELESRFFPQNAEKKGQSDAQSAAKTLLRTHC